MTEPTETHPDHTAAHARKRGFLARLRGSFLTGLVVISPIGLTLYLMWTVAGWVDGWVLPFVPAEFQPERYIGVNIRGFGVIFFLIFTVIVGWLAKNIIGRSVLRFGESLVDRMPVVRSVYNGLKQIAETVFAQGETKFDRACLVDYPLTGSKALAFVSARAKGEIARSGPANDPLISVFMPTTPNPTTGFLMFVPESQVTYLDMSVEDAAKLIISAGLVYPAEKSQPARLPA
ncbi:DUF502 domain-containing protein [Paenirhodobacter hankyongi]|uniref:DUF502 domain-containing protein n=1 Tax=Paenirhodobacter hankyongi TaxID=2294033 RepID=A0A421BRP9_9RHOB|nr:DUF502 domain-containing protein [Sinirhodobacter hankyongi]RLL70959.1 DUF502 domain-containing protein [Sinirhodobacter hankyongi]